MLSPIQIIFVLYFFKAANGYSIDHFTYFIGIKDHSFFSIPFKPLLDDSVLYRIQIQSKDVSQFNRTGNFFILKTKQKNGKSGLFVGSTSSS